MPCLHIGQRHKARSVKRWPTVSWHLVHIFLALTSIDAAESPAWPLSPSLWRDPEDDRLTRSSRQASRRVSERWCKVSMELLSQHSRLTFLLARCETLQLTLGTFVGSEPAFFTSPAPASASSDTHQGRALLLVRRSRTYEDWCHEATGEGCFSCPDGEAYRLSNLDGQVPSIRAAVIPSLNSQIAACPGSSIPRLQIQPPTAGGILPAAWKCPLGCDPMREMRPTVAAPPSV